MEVNMAIDQTESNQAKPNTEKKNKLEITEKRSGEELTVMLEGRLDTSTYSELQRFLDKRDGFTVLYIDMAQTEYVSSAGLRVLLDAAKRMDAANGTMKVKNVNQEVRETFCVTGFDEILTIE